jgi:hypothetical protein
MSLEDKPDVILLVRSYRRPNFLSQTLESLISSDIDICKNRYIYDDCSEDPRTKRVLSDPKYINEGLKGFELIRGRTNVGVKQSYVDALNYIRDEKFDIVITVDNDVVVKPDFIKVLVSEFKNVVDKYKSLEVLFTGFNPTNAHLNSIEDFGTFYRKYSCGGVNFVFHKEFLGFIVDAWDKGEDNSVMNMMNIKKFPLCCIKTSVLNHMGSVGLHADGSSWDTDEKFTYEDVNLLEIRPPLDDGLYFIKPVLNNDNKFDEALLACHNTLTEDFRDVNSRYVLVHTRQAKNPEWQGDKWLVERLGDGTYKIMLQNNMLLNINNGNSNSYFSGHLYYDSDKRAGNSMYLYVHKNFTGSVWNLEPVGENMFYIVLDLGDKEYLLSVNDKNDDDKRDINSVYVNATPNRKIATKWCFIKI